MLPLGEKLGGLDAVKLLTLPEALNYRDAIGDRGELEEYYMWLGDKRREQEKEERGESTGEKHLATPKSSSKSKWDVTNRDKPMEVLMQREKDPKKVDRAMNSVGSYTTFLKGRGFSGAGLNGF